MPTGCEMNVSSRRLFVLRERLGRIAIIQVNDKSPFGTQFVIDGFENGGVGRAIKIAEAMPEIYDAVKCPFEAMQLPHIQRLEARMALCRCPGLVDGIEIVVDAQYPIARRQQRPAVPAPAAAEIQQAGKAGRRHVPADKCHLVFRMGSGYRLRECLVPKR